LDRQIVDTSGAKVVRVNDLHFLHVPTGDLHLVHVDVGFRGLVRRLGWSTTMGKEQLISWRYVQPLTLAATGDTLQLTVTRKELGRLHPAELADILTELDGRERESLFRALAPEAAARALTEVEPKVRQRLIAGLPAERAADIVERMPPDEAADLLATPPAPLGAPAREDGARRGRGRPAALALRARHRGRHDDHRVRHPAVPPHRRRGARAPARARPRRRAHLLHLPGRPRGPPAGRGHDPP